MKRVCIVLLRHRPQVECILTIVTGLPLSLSAQSFVTELNSHRTHKLELKSDQSAKRWAKYLGKTGHLGHDSNLPNGRGEIVLETTNNETEFFESWYNSPRHKKLTMDESFDYVSFYR